MKYNIDRSGRVTGPGRVKANKRGYLYVGNHQYIHRMVASKYVPNPHGHRVVDHVNGNIKDNSARNLRWVSQKQNSMNRFRRHDNKSGVQGVSWDKNKRRWRAVIRNHLIGRFKSKDAAVKERKLCERKCFNKFKRH
jgi:hypothetical protein